MIKKDDIFLIAKRLLEEDGYKNFTIRKLASEANVSIGSIYNLFTNKENIIIQVIESYWDESITYVLNNNRAFQGSGIEKIENLYVLFFNKSKDFHSGFIKDIEGLRMSNESIYNISQKFFNILIDRLKEIIIEDKTLYMEVNNSLTIDRLASLIHLLFSNNNPLINENIIFLRDVLYRLFNLPSYKI